MRFLHALAHGGNVRRAAEVVDLSAQSAYVLRRRDPVFAGAWDAALVLALDEAEQVLAERAIHGTPENVFYRGELVGRKVRHDSRLLLAHLGRLDRRLELNPLAEERAGRFDELLAYVAEGGEGGAWEPAPLREDMMDAAEDAAIEAFWRGPVEEEDNAGADQAAEQGAEQAGAGPDGPWGLTAEEVADLGALRAEARRRAAAEWDAMFDAAVGRVEAALGGREIKGMVPLAPRAPCLPLPGAGEAPATVSTSSTSARRSRRSGSHEGQRSRCASSRRRSALSLMKPAASFWS